MADNIISTLGAGSGIDIKNLVTQLTAVERAPKEARLNTRQEQLQAQISGYGQLKSAFDTFKGALKALGDGDLFNARSVTVPSSEVITANSVDPGAQTGAYSIEVLEVASAHSLAIGAHDERDVALDKSGQLTIQFGDWTYDGGTGAPTSFGINGDRAALTVEIESGDSLDDIAEKINAGNAGVQASVVKVDDQYQLMLTASSGASNALKITAGTGAVGLNEFVFDETTQNATETQQGQDAQIKVNGLAVTRETNEIDDVIQGFSFTLNKKGAAGEKLNFSITADKSGAEQAMRDFVAAYNSFQETTQKLVGYSRDDDNNLVRGGLAGDSTARAMIERMRAQIGGAVPGVQSGFTALTNVGIRTERDGSLSINETDLKNAINNNFALLEGLFAGKSSATNTAVAVKSGTFASRATAGTYSAEITRDPTKGQAVGSAATADLNTLNVFDTNGAVFAFQIDVGGVVSNSIDIGNNIYTSSEQLRADIQSQLDADTVLTGAGIALEVSYDSANKRFSFTNSANPGASLGFANATADMATLGIVAGASAAQPLVGASMDSDATFGNYNFKVNVDGITSDLIELNGSYTSPDQVRAALQSQINGDAKLKAAGVGVDVGYDAATQQFSFVSREYGSASQVMLTETSADMGLLGITPTSARIQGNGLTAAGFDAGTDAFTTSLDTSGGGYDFKMRVDGVESNSISLSGSYATAADLQSALQAAIDADTNLSGAGVGVKVGYDTDADRFTFTSNATGTSSSVSFTERSDAMASLGIETVLSGTRGVDVAGTIDGIEGFGAGNVLLPDLDSGAYGLNLSVSAGAKAQGAFEFSFARGLAGELSNMIENFLGSTGTLKTREDSLQKQLDGLKEERTALDRRMESFSARLQAQFISMENIVSSLQDTGSQLDGLVDRLPFTASK